MTARTGGTGRRAGGVRAAAGRADRVRVAAAHTLPVLVRGFVSARPRAARGHAGPGRPRWSAATLRALRARYGGAPVLVRGLTGAVLLILDPQDVRRFYDEPAGTLALAPLPGAPDGCAHAGLRAERRAVDDSVLAAGLSVHPSCGPFLSVLAEEARRLTAGGTLELARVRHVVARAARRIVLGDAAAEDAELTRRIGRFHDKAGARIAAYAELAEPHTLVGRARRLGDPTGSLDPVGQARQWLAAFGLVPASCCAPCCSSAPTRPNRTRSPPRRARPAPVGANCPVCGPASANHCGCTRPCPT